MDKVNNPHDRMIRETLSRKETAVDFFKNYLPNHVLDLIDMDSLEISKDSFIEKELADFYSDILYKVEYKGRPGFVYLLFEHKSYQETLIQFQLFGYIHKIYSLYLKQTKAKKLPIILPMVFYHGRKKWEISTRFSAVLDGPYEVFKGDILDFKYILLDLSRYTDEQIKIEIQIQLLLILLKYISDPVLFHKPPDMVSLLFRIIQQDTESQIFSTIFKYISIVFKEIYEGRRIGYQQGLKQGLEMGLGIKFGDKGLSYVQKIKNITDIQKLQNIVEAIKIVKKLDELDYIIG